MKYRIDFVNDEKKQRCEVAKFHAEGDALICLNALQVSTSDIYVRYELIKTAR